MVNRSSWTAHLPVKCALVLLEHFESTCLTCPLEKLCSIRASYFLSTDSCHLLEAADKSIMFTFPIWRMFDVLLVLYVDLQHAAIQVGFMGTEENSDSLPSLPLLVYPTYLKLIICPLSLSFVSEQVMVSVSGSHTQSY